MDSLQAKRNMDCMSIDNDPIVALVSPAQDDQIMRLSEAIAKARELPYPEAMARFRMPDKKILSLSEAESYLQARPLTPVP